MNDNNLEILLENDVLIINPKIESITSVYKVKFEEKFDNIMYFFQFCEIGDENDYYSYVFYDFDGKNFCFLEYDNPEHMSFHTENTEMKEEEFLDKISDIDKKMSRDKFGFSSCLERYKNKNNLEKELNSQKNRNKKIKL